MNDHPFFFFLLLSFSILFSLSRLTLNLCLSVSCLSLVWLSVYLSVFLFLFLCVSLISYVYVSFFQSLFSYSILFLFNLQESIKGDLLWRLGTRWNGRCHAWSQGSSLSSIIQTLSSSTIASLMESSSVLSQNTVR